MAHKLGRLARSYDPRIPHLSALVAGKTIAPPPPACDWTEKMPKNNANATASAPEKAGIFV